MIPLVDADMEAPLCMLLQTNDRADTHQLLAAQLLSAMRHAGAWPTPIRAQRASWLMRLVRDASWRSAVRKAGLRALLRLATVTDLQALRRDILAGSVEDSDDELIGLLLLQLLGTTDPTRSTTPVLATAHEAAPAATHDGSGGREVHPAVAPGPQTAAQDVPSAPVAALTPAQALDALHAPKASRSFGSYVLFWHFRLSPGVEARQLPQWLDAFAGHPHARAMRALPQTHRLYVTPLAALLQRVLTESPEAFSNAQLLDWLDALCDDHARSQLRDEDTLQSLSEWLAQRPQHHQALLAMALERYWAEPSTIGNACARLHDAWPLPDAHGWWLTRAAMEQAPARRIQCLRQALKAVNATVRSDGRATLDHVLAGAAALAAQGGFSAEWHALLSSSLEQEGRHHDTAPSQLGIPAGEVTSTRTRHQAWGAQLANGDPSEELVRALLAEWDEPPWQSLDDEETPPASGRDRIERVVGVALAPLAQDWLCTLVANPADLRSVQEVLRAAEDEDLYLINRAAVVGAQLQHEDDPGFLAGLDRSTLQLLLVSHFCEGASHVSGWVSAAVRERPDAVAAALHAHLDADLRRRRRATTGADLLARSSWQEVAKLCLLGLLRGLPGRLHRVQAQPVYQLAQTAMRLFPASRLLALAEHGLDHASAGVRALDAAQRMAWLVLAACVGPQPHRAALDAYLSKPHRCKRVAGFLAHNALPEDTDIRTVALLLERFAALCHPRAVDLTHSRVLRAPDALVSVVGRLLHHLAESSGEDAFDALDRLGNLASMSAWLGRIRDAQERQRNVRRDARFTLPGTEDIERALTRAAPATQEELFDVLNELLEEFCEQFRGHHLDLRVQYYNTDAQWGRPKPGEPRHEERCRDVFAMQIQPALQRFAIDAIPENRHAQSNRSDLYCIRPGAGVPLEFKRATHKELWSAAHAQLIARYANDPRTAGFGIYVVIWFGPDKVPSAPDGQHPKTAAELKESLVRHLNLNAHPKLAAHVIDCALGP